MPTYKIVYVQNNLEICVSETDLTCLGTVLNYLLKITETKHVALPSMNKSANLIIYIFNLAIKVSLPMMSS